MPQGELSIGHVEPHTMTKDIPLPNSIRDEMERIYAEMSPAEIPWNMEDPPRELVDLVESGQVTPCKTIDIGCGAGNYAVYLASRGFDVTGVDISSSAIALARESAKNRDVKCNFLIADVLEGLEEFELDTIHTTGSVITTPWFFQPPLVDKVNNQILVGWVDFSFMSPIPAGTNGLAFTLVGSLPAGASADCIDMDSSFVPPAGGCKSARLSISCRNVFSEKDKQRHRRQGRHNHSPHGDVFSRLLYHEESKHTQEMGPESVQNRRLQQ